MGVFPVGLEEHHPEQAVSEQRAGESEDICNWTCRKTNPGAG